MTVHRASCRCGQLKAEAEGDPVRVSVCHCRACQKRTGSAFSAQVRWPQDKVATTGRSNAWHRQAASGNPVTYNFCPDCGATVFFTIVGKFDGLVAIPLGLFDDPYAFRPAFSVWEECRHDWVEITGDTVEHLD